MLGVQWLIPGQVFSLNTTGKLQQMPSVVAIIPELKSRSRCNKRCHFLKVKLNCLIFLEKMIQHWRTMAPMLVSAKFAWQYNIGTMRWWWWFITQSTSFFKTLIFNFKPSSDCAFNTGNKVKYKNWWIMPYQYVLILDENTTVIP